MNPINTLKNDSQTMRNVGYHARAEIQSQEFHPIPERTQQDHQQDG